MDARTAYTRRIEAMEPPSEFEQLEIFEDAVPTDPDSVEERLVTGDSPLPAPIVAPGSAEHHAIEVASPPSSRLPHMVRALRHRNFRNFWIGNFLSNIGTWMQNIAQGWLVLVLTNSPFWLGVVSFAAAVPMLIFALLGGVIADQVDKRRLIMVTQSAMMVFAFVLAGLSYFKVITVQQIIILAFLNGVAQALNMPSYQALVPQLIPPEDLTNAVAINSAQFNLSRVLGPTLGGFAMAWFGVTGNFFLNGISFIAVLFALTRIDFPQRAGHPEGGLWRRLKEGFHYVFYDPTHSIIRTLVWVICIASLFAIPYMSFVPYFARDILHSGERGLGYLMACSGLGAFLGAATIAYTGKVRHRGKFVATSGAGFFLAIIIFSLSHNFWLSAVTQVAAGYLMIMMVATINTLLQELTTNQMRGRVMSIYGVAFLGLAPVGSLASGALAKLLKPSTAIAGMAAIALIATTATYLTRPELRELD